MKLAPPEHWEPLEESIPKDVFKSEVSAWAKSIGVEPKEVHIRPMKRKWGSCSTNGRLSFASDLLKQRADFRRRVMIEELLHLRFPNHGKLFKALLKAYCNETVNVESGKMKTKT